MNITIFGSGYVGLVTGACFADFGHNVTCVDVDEEKISSLNNGKIPIYEPGLSELILKNIDDKNIKFTTDAEYGVKKSLLQFIAVGTPPGEDGSADLTYVKNVAQTIAEHMESEKIIVTKSTVPVGTSHKITSLINTILDKHKKDISFGVCSNPEFLKEGSAIDDFKNGSRVVIGTESHWVEEKMRECYNFYTENTELIFMDTVSSELTKYAANAMLATKISFMNELSNIADLYEANIEDIKYGIGTDPRIGHHFINPGCGYGGSCFPKDVKALISQSKEKGYVPNILDSVENTNNQQKNILYKKLAKSIDLTEPNIKISIWGLSFKPNTDDIREAPSISLIKKLLNKNISIYAYDPKGSHEIDKYFNSKKITFCDDPLTALNNSSALVICTDWDEFKHIGIEKIIDRLQNPLIIDGRNIYNLENIVNFDIEYHSIGRPPVIPKT